MMDEQHTPAGHRGDRMWVRLPQLVGRRVPSLGLVLADGSWLRAWPVAGLVAPVVALAAGALAGALRPDPGSAFTEAITLAEALPAVLVLVAVAGVGAAPGLWALAGYVVTDLAVHPPAATADASASLWSVHGPRLVSFLLLAVLLVVLPLAATGLRVQVLSRVPRAGVLARALGPLLQGALFGAGVALWIHAATVLLGRQPTAAALVTLVDRAPLSDGAVLVGIAAGIVAAGRRIVAANAEIVAPPPVPPPAATGQPWWLRAPARAVLILLLLSGLIADAGATAVVTAVTLTACLAHLLVLPRLAAFVGIVERIPLIVRLALVGGLASLLAGLLVVPAVEQGEDALGRVLAAVLLAVVLAGLVMPPAGDAPTTPAPADDPGGVEEMADR